VSRRHFSIAVCCFAVLALHGRAQEIVTPEQALGRPVGTDFQLADWEEVQAYFTQLGDASPNMRVQTVGTTTEGRDLITAVISYPSNLDRLDELKANARRIADPRGIASDEEAAALLDDSRLFLFITCNIHSTEIASPEMSMQLAYELATSDAEPWASARREMVIVLIPSVNPDGMDRVVQWYRDIEGTPYETAPLTELYQRYAGHDNNRDFFALSLKETQIVTSLLYQEWFPQIYWDVHQQRSNRERMFVPPFRDPLNPNIDPEIVGNIAAIGGRMLMDLTTEGFSGVATGVTYDMWWTGGNRSVPYRHNIVGLLTEAASVSLATPLYFSKADLTGPGDIGAGYAPSNRFPNPWPGGWWRIGDIVDYEMAAARSLLGTLSREPRRWMRGALNVSQRAIAKGEHDSPHAWLITTDNRDRDAVKRLLETLMHGGVEVQVAEDEFVADDLTYPSGTLVVRRAQPYGAYAKDLLEVQRYPDGPAPYDVSGWTLPMLLGVRRVEAVRPLTVATRALPTVDAALAALPAAMPVALPWPSVDGDDTDGIRRLFRALSRDLPARLVTEAPSDDPLGWWMFTGDAGRDASPDAEPAASVDGEYGVEAVGVTFPRIGVYAPWTASMDEGWLRWTLDYCEVPYRRIRNEAVRAGRLNDHLDVLILPSVSPSTLRDGRAEGDVFARFTGGLEPEGTVAIEEFVRAGGTLIACDQAADFAIALFGLELENAVGRGGDAFKCPGSVLRTVPASDSPWTVGFPASQPVYFSNSRAYAPKPGKEDPKQGDDVVGEALLTYPKSGILLSGWARNAQRIAGASAWRRLRIGDGQVHLFGFRPHYRSWSQTTFKALFRAILLPAEPTAAEFRSETRLDAADEG
jgi:hypothetical protein